LTLIFSNAKNFLKAMGIEEMTELEKMNPHHISKILAFENVLTEKHKRNAGSEKSANNRA
jgi:predicted RecB family nuclease